MTSGTTNTSSNASLASTLSAALSNYYSSSGSSNGISSIAGGLGNYPIGGYGPTGSTDGDFSSLLSSLNSSGTFGPGLYNTTGVPTGSNPQAISLASEAASTGTSLLLNKLAPLNLPPEAMYSSSIFGGISSGISLLDTLTSFASGIAAVFPQGSSAAQLLRTATPVLGAVNGIFGVVQGLRAYNNKPTVRLASTPDAIDDYIEEADA